MITTLIICLTVVFCVIWITLWVKHMSVNGLPMFTHGECVWKDKVEEPTQGETNPIGFSAEETSEPETPEKKSDKEQKEAVLKDPITMFSALLRGEVDIDDITT